MSCPRCGCKEIYQYDDEDAPDDTWQRCAACGAIFPIEDETPEDDDEPTRCPSTGELFGEKHE